MSYLRTKPYSAPPFAVTHPSTQQGASLQIPGYRQARTYSCGFACTLMVLRHFGIRLCGAPLFAALGTTRRGTEQTSIVQVLRSQAIVVEVRDDMDFANLQSWIDGGKLLIGYREDTDHWLVLYGYARCPKRIYVADPEPLAFGQEHRCEHLWDNYGKELGGFAITCCL